MCSLPLQKNVGKKTSFFTMCHYSEFHKITYVNCRRNDLQDDVKFSLGKCFLVTQELFKIAHGRHKITPYVDCVTKELRSNPAFEITWNRTGERFQEQITNLYPVLLNYFVIEVCFCRDIPPSFCLVRLCTSATNGIRLKNFDVLLHTNLKFLPLIWLANPCLLTSLW